MKGCRENAVAEVGAARVTGVTRHGERRGLYSRAGARLPPAVVPRVNLVAAGGQRPHDRLPHFPQTNIFIRLGLPTWQMTDFNESADSTVPGRAGSGYPVAPSYLEREKQGTRAG